MISYRVARYLLFLLKIEISKLGRLSIKDLLLVLRTFISKELHLDLGSTF